MTVFKEFNDTAWDSNKTFAHGGGTEVNIIDERGNTAACVRYHQPYVIAIVTVESKVFRHRRTDNQRDTE